MKTQIIKIISAVVLFTASVNVFGQTEVEKVCKMDFSKLSIEEIKEIVSKLSPEDKQALLNSTNEDCNLLQGLIDAMYNTQNAVQSAQNGNSELASCQASSYFDDNNCKEKAQDAEKSDKQNYSAQRNQIKQDLKDFLDAINEYNAVVMDYNKAHLNNESRRNELAGQVGPAANKARSVAGSIINNAAVNQSVISDVKEIDNSLLKYNSDGTLQPARDLESLRQFIDCDDCFLKK